MSSPLQRPALRRQAAHARALAVALALVTLAACAPVSEPAPADAPTAAPAEEAETAVPETAVPEEKAAGEQTAVPEEEAPDAEATASSVEEAAAEPEAEALAFNSWTINRLYGIDTLGSAPATAEFVSDTELVGFTGCNDYAATFASSDDGTVEVTNVALTTDNPCRSDAAATQELLLQQGLADAATYELSGADLSLLDASGETVLVMRNAATLELAGSTWFVTGYDNTAGEFVPVLPEGPALTMVVTGSGVSGFSGCNNYAATAQVVGDAITIDNVSSSGSGSGSAECQTASPLVDQEAAYRKALTTARTWSIGGAQLIFFGEDGEPVATYIPGAAAQ